MIYLPYKAYVYPLINQNQQKNFSIILKLIQIIFTTLLIILTMMKKFLKNIMKMQNSQEDIPYSD